MHFFNFKFLVLLLFCVFKSYCSVFAQDNSNKLLVVKEFKIIGNKTTRENIIVREASVGIGDTIAADKLDKELQKTKSNLFNTSLFNFVTVEPVYFDSTHISIYITVEERWYWWPIPVFDIEETNFNTWWLDKDFDRVNYGLFLAKENFRGRKETLMFLAQGGYTEKVGFKYEVPYINKKKTAGLNVRFAYGRNHEITYGTTNNTRDFYRSENKYVKKEINSSLGYEYRPKLYNKHALNLGYTSLDVADSVVLLNLNYLSGVKSSMQFLTLQYKVKRDKRDNKNYPIKGSYYDFGIRKDGLSLFDKNLNKLHITTHLKKFWQLSNRIYFASSLRGKYTLKEGPYFLYNGLGYGNDLVRGYEFYVINGEHYGVAKIQIRYALLKNKIFNVKAIAAKKFNKIPLAIYMGSYFDAGYVDSKINSSTNFLSNTILYGGGVSVDFVSYYDLVLRVEYSVNKLKEKGLFVHFIAPI
ncbi:MAG: hypothetical protein JKY30_10175 [Flavobacteriales bacterium]|nr:hypothetical protein [Flavobacteriales bacterium]